MNDFLSSIIAQVTTLAITVLGVLIGFWLATWHERRAANGKRRALLKQLRVELQRIEGDLPPFSPDKTVISYAIRLVTPQLLLDGDPRYLEKGEQFVDRLVNLQAGVSVHNDLAQQYFLVQLLSPNRITAQEPFYRLLKAQREAVLVVRDEILSHLPEYPT